MAGQAQVPVPPLPRNARPGHQPLGQVFSSSKGKYLQLHGQEQTRRMVGVCSPSGVAGRKRFLPPAPALLTRGWAAPALLWSHSWGGLGTQRAVPAPECLGCLGKAKAVPQAPVQQHQGQGLLTSVAAFLPFVPPQNAGAPASRKPAGKKLRGGLSLPRRVVQGTGGRGKRVKKFEIQTVAFGGVVPYQAALQPDGLHLGLMSKRWEGKREADRGAGCPCDSCAPLLC